MDMWSRLRLVCCWNSFTGGILDVLALCNATPKNGLSKANYAVTVASNAVPQETGTARQSVTGTPLQLDLLHVLLHHTQLFGGT